MSFRGVLTRQPGQSLDDAASVDGVALWRERVDEAHEFSLHRGRGCGERPGEVEVGLLWVSDLASREPEYADL